MKEPDVLDISYQNKCSYENELHVWQIITSTFDLSCTMFQSAYSDVCSYKACPTIEESIVDDDDHDFNVHEITMTVMAENDHSYA